MAMLFMPARGANATGGYSYADCVWRTASNIILESTVEYTTDHDVTEMNAASVPEHVATVRRGERSVRFRRRDF